MKLKAALTMIVRSGRGARSPTGRAAALLGGALLLATPAMAGETRNVVLIVIDGVRGQEVFSGADPLLLNAEAGGSWETEKELKARYWSDDPNTRRRLLLPFLWEVVARQGQIYGNLALGSVARVTNAQDTSYAGYNEMSVGFPDPTIDDTNEHGPNANVSVFEWLNGRTEFAGQVAIFGNWPTYKDIFNAPRSHLYIQADAPPPTVGKPTPRQALLRRLYETTTLLDVGAVPDSFTQVALLDYVGSAHPRVLFVGYGDTDDWAHSGRYDNVLESAHHADAFIRELWQTMQAMSKYRGKTTFIITTDHGRGSGPVDWKEHGVEQKGSENVWIAVLGPDTPALGERRNAAPVTQAQIAATIAALLGRDYRAAEPRAAPPLAEVLAR